MPGCVSWPATPKRAVMLRNFCQNNKLAGSRFPQHTFSTEATEAPDFSESVISTAFPCRPQLPEASSLGLDSMCKLTAGNARKQSELLNVPK